MIYDFQKHCQLKIYCELQPLFQQLPMVLESRIESWPLVMTRRQHTSDGAEKSRVRVSLDKVSNSSAKISMDESHPL